MQQPQPHTPHTTGPHVRQCTSLTKVDARHEVAPPYVGAPIWGLACVLARRPGTVSGMAWRKGAKAPGGFPPGPLRGLTAYGYAGPAPRPPPGGHGPATPFWRSARRYSTQDKARVLQSCTSFLTNVMPQELTSPRAEMCVSPSRRQHRIVVAVSVQ
eukprot:7387239-Prymnesium_polylepis.1